MKFHGQSAMPGLISWIMALEAWMIMWTSKRVPGNTRNNFKISVKESLGYSDLKENSVVC
jgi:hypothetical protein